MRRSRECRTQAMGKAPKNQETGAHGGARVTSHPDPATVPVLHETIDGQAACRFRGWVWHSQRRERYRMTETLLLVSTSHRSTPVLSCISSCIFLERRREGRPLCELCVSRGRSRGSRRVEQPMSVWNAASTIVASSNVASAKQVMAGWEVHSI